MPVQQVLTDQRVPVKIWTNDVDDRSKEQLANIAGLTATRSESNWSRPPS